MSKYNFRVKVAGVLLPEMQTLTLNTGRRQLTDTFKAGTATITGRNLSTLPNVTIGQPMDIEYDQGTGVYALWWSGYVSDLQKSYGFTTAEDQWTLYCEDSLAAMGRASTRSGFSWSAGITTYDAASFAANDASVTVSPGFGSFARSTVSAQSVPNTNLLTLLNTLAATEQARIVQGRDGGSGVPGPYVEFLGRDRPFNALNNVFTDNTVATALPKLFYNRVEFLSQADSYYDVVIVEPEGLAAQTEGSGDRVYTLATYDQTTTQADNLASYLVNLLSGNTSVPFSVSLTGETQVNNQAIEIAPFASYGVVAQVILRGSTYNVTIEGATVSADPSQSRITFYLAPASLTIPFILDSATQGVLDTNRLGF